MFNRVCRPSGAFCLHGSAPTVKNGGLRCDVPSGLRITAAHSAGELGADLGATVITTERLRLRTWKDEDFPPYAEMNADPRVREFFPTIHTREMSDAEIRRIQSLFENDGFTMFAAELIATGEFIGFVGIATLTFAIPGVPQPAVEIGWRLAHKFWGNGYATEGARGVLRYAFETITLREIVSITVPGNVRSRRVMEKIGMHHFPELDFDHRRISEGHPLRRHVLYALKNHVVTP